jgi:hypothetical protein
MMNKLLRLAVLVGFMTVVSSGARAGTIAHLWSRSYGFASDQRPRSVAVDASGNVIRNNGFGAVERFLCRGCGGRWLPGLVFRIREIPGKTK